jgi:hypothetical protein
MTSGRKAIAYLEIGPLWIEWHPAFLRPCGRSVVAGGERREFKVHKRLIASVVVPS